MAAASGTAFADCSPPPTEGPDTITCDAPTNDALDALGGNDTVNYVGGTGTIVRGGLGDDTLNLTTGILLGNPVLDVNGNINKYVAVTGNKGLDTIVLGSGMTIGSATAGVSTDVSGDDNNITPGAEEDQYNDTIILEGATVYGFIRADRGTQNAITLESGSILEPGNATGSQSGVIGSKGDDTVTVGGVAGKTVFVERQINTEMGDDTVYLRAGATVGSVDTREGTDHVELDGATIGTARDGNGITLGLGHDEAHLRSGTVNGNVLGGLNALTDTLDGTDDIYLEGATITGAIRGGAGDDNLISTSGSARFVIGDQGDDTIKIGDETNPSAPGPRIDTVLGDNGRTVAPDGTNGVEAGMNGADHIWMYNGAVGRIAGDAGGDDIHILGGTVTGAVSGGADDDAIVWSGGRLGSIDGGTGSDTVTVTAAAYDGSQTLDGGDDALPTDGDIDRLTLANKTIATTGGKLVNWEKITLQGGGLTLSDGQIAVGGPTDKQTGLFLTNGAYLRTTNSPLTLTGNLSIGPGSSLEQLVTGAQTVTGHLANSGSIDLRGRAGNVLAVGGDYTGGGDLLVDIVGDKADRMTVGGDVLGSPTRILATPVAAGNTGTPIEVVRVAGATADGDFTANDFTLGAFSYSLARDGKVWQFVVNDLSDGGTLYPSLGVMMNNFTRDTVATHFERTGSWTRARIRGEEETADNSVTTLAGGGRDAPGKVWLRAIGSWADGDGKLKGAPGNIGTQSVSYNRDEGGVQGGADVIVAETSSYLVTAGLFGQTGRLSGDAKNETTGRSAGSVDATAWGLGGSLGIDTHDYYAEIVGGWNSYDVTTDAHAGQSSTNGNGYFVSLEGGAEFALTSAVRLIPQAQFAWIGTDLDNFTDADGSLVSYNGGNGTVGRLGLAVDADAGSVNDQPLRLTGILNYWQNFGDAPEATVNGAVLSLSQDAGTLEAGGGFHWGTEASPMNLHGELTYRDTVTGEGEQSWNGTLGMRIAF